MAAPAREAARYPPDLPVDEPAMSARAQGTRGPQTQLDATRVRSLFLSENGFGGCCRPLRADLC